MTDSESKHKLKSPSRASLGNNVIALVAIAFVFFIAVLVFLYFNNSRYLDDFKVLLNENENSSHKMQLFSEFAELARGRTRNTIQILESDDVFEQDELNQQLEGFAGKFAIVREQLDEMPFIAEDKKLYDAVFKVVQRILPRQRRAVELLMHEGDREEARRLIYESVLPGQQEIIDIFHELIKRERQHITDNSDQINRSMLEVNQHNNLLFSFILVLFTGLSGFIIYRISRIQRQVGKAYESLEETVQERTQDLKLARDAALTASKSKSEFLSSMSHELRTPLNAIIGFSQLLEMEEMDPIQKDSVSEIHKAGKHLLDLINEVLDLARIEAGRMAADMQEVELGAVLSEVHSLAVPIAARYGVSLGVVENADYTILADYKRLKQVFLNLISNAIKYNCENGSVSVYTENLGDKVRICIKDTGKGIAPEQREGLFEPFNRLGAEGSEIEGSGIGMMVTSQLVELMNGNIDFSSTVGEGSIFWVDFAVVMSSESQVAGSDAETGFPAVTDEMEGKDGVRVLYIEDNMANLKFMERLLASQTDYRLLQAITPQAGLEVALSTAPDIILMDINMPEMNGYEVLEQLKATEKTAKIPVFAVTASAMPENISKGLNAGFDDYLTKPVDINKLMASMEKALR
jgi:signal transduction histidine kinase/ActR/RegA family two-component response regulator